MPTYRYDEFDEDDVDDLAMPSAIDLEIEGKQARRLQRTQRPSATTESRKPKLRSPRKEADQAFKCGHCRQFIGAPVVGGRQRNHCPNCLYSRHVDGSMPGDRKSDCHALMRPVGIMSRRNGEEVLIHYCLGCGKYDPNRIAADDNPVLLETIPVVGSIEEAAELVGVANRGRR